MIVDIRRIGVSAIFAEAPTPPAVSAAVSAAVAAAVSAAVAVAVAAGSELESDDEQAVNMPETAARAAIAMAGLDQLIMMPP